MRLTAIKILEGKITLKSGLHIGSGDMEMHIGGTDSPVIKHPHTLEPYIPGSSLKGKVRSLLEMESGLMIYTDGDVASSGTLFTLIKKSYMAGLSSPRVSISPFRVILRSLTSEMTSEKIILLRFLTTSPGPPERGR